MPAGEGWGGAYQSFKAQHVYGTASGVSRSLKYKHEKENMAKLAESRRTQAYCQLTIKTKRMEFNKASKKTVSMKEYYNNNKMVRGKGF